MDLHISHLLRDGLMMRLAFLKRPNASTGDGMKANCYDGNHYEHMHYSRQRHTTNRSMADKCNRDSITLISSYNVARFVMCMIENA